MAFVMACGPLLFCSASSLRSYGSTKARPRRRHFRQIPAKGLSRSSRSLSLLPFASPVFGGDRSSDRHIAGFRFSVGDVAHISLRRGANCPMLPI
ncbi:MAG: hypothetical protein EOR84_03855 [Mesorhizobium sp.]|nr:MAG: hypothetical protein EOR84_03855 [Mesorhizobium sp.]